LKNINPLFLLIASAFILFISIYSINSVNSKSNIISKNYKNYKKIALKYNNLKEQWTDVKSQKKLLEKLIQKNKVKNTNIKQIQNTLKVKITNIDTKKLHNFINKLLNTKLSIYKLKFGKNYIEFEVVTR
jgi:predicted PurR-regulated permease PerM